MYVQFVLQNDQQVDITMGKRIYPCPQGASHLHWQNMNNESWFCGNIHHTNSRAKAPGTASRNHTMNKHRPTMDIGYILWTGRRRKSIWTILHKNGQYQTNCINNLNHAYLLMACPPRALFRLNPFIIYKILYIRTHF